MIEIDLNDFTLGEIEEIEATAGVAFTELFKSNKSGLAMAACLWITKRRDDPGYTLEVAKTAKLAEIEFKSPDVDPTDGNGSAKSSPLPTSSI